MEAFYMRINKSHHICCNKVISHLAAKSIAKVLKLRAISIVNSYASLGTHSAKPYEEWLGLVAIIYLVEVINEYRSNPLQHFYFECFVQPHPIVQWIPGP